MHQYIYTIIYNACIMTLKYISFYLTGSRFRNDSLPHAWRESRESREYTSLDLATCTNRKSHHAHTEYNHAVVFISSFLTHCRKFRLHEHSFKNSKKMTNSFYHTVYQHTPCLFVCLTYLVNNIPL